MSATADIIIRNAKVLTMEPSNMHAEAVAVSGNKLLAVGSNSEIDALLSGDTQIFDAEGATVLPGFVESHLHLFGGSAGLDKLDLSSTMGRTAFSEVVKTYNAKNPGTDILFAHGANYTILDGDAITRHDLDEAVPDRGFFMMAPDAHTAWANTKALEAAGLLQGKEINLGSEIVMGADGLASGELRGVDAFSPVLALSSTGGRENLGYTTAEDPVPPATAEQKADDIEILTRGLDYCASLGLTSLQNMDGNFYQLELLDEIEKEHGGLKARIEVPFHMKNDKPFEKIATDAVVMRERYQSEKLFCRRVKLFMDGVLDSGTALVLGGYPDAPDHDGDPLFTAEEFNAIAIEADRLGFQIAVHAIGDGAVRRTLDGYRAALETNGKRDSRHRIEHIEIIDSDDIPRFAELGVIASMQPLHALGTGGFPLEPTRTKIGEAKLPNAYAWQTLKDAGAKLCFATDWPVSPLDPLLSIKAAMTREKLHPSYPDQSQSLLDTLAAYTTDGAYAEHAEDKKGKLKPGMLADVVMLSGNIESTAPEEIDQLSVSLTICDGVITHMA